MLLVECCQLALEGSRFPHYVQGEIRFSKWRPAGRRQQRVTDRRRPEFKQIQTGSNGRGKLLGSRRQAQVEMPHRAEEPHVNVRNRSITTDCASTVQEDPSTVHLPPSAVAIDASLLRAQGGPLNRCTCVFPLVGIRYCSRAHPLNRPLHAGESRSGNGECRHPPHQFGFDFKLTFRLHAVVQLDVRNDRGAIVG